MGPSKGRPSVVSLVKVVSVVVGLEGPEDKGTGPGPLTIGTFRLPEANLCSVIIGDKVRQCKGCSVNTLFNRPFFLRLGNMPPRSCVSSNTTNTKISLRCTMPEVRLDV